MGDRHFLGTKINPPNLLANDMPDTSQLLTNEPFINEDNTNKFILNFSRSDCITKKEEKKNKDKQNNKETTKKTKRKNKKTLISHHTGVRERKA